MTVAKAMIGQRMLVLAEVSLSQPLHIQGGNPIMSVTRIPLSAAEEEARQTQARLEMSTAEIGLTVRTTNCLEEKGIFTVQDLLNTPRSELLSISNFGEKTLEEVYRALERIGFFRPARRVRR